MIKDVESLCAEVKGRQFSFLKDQIRRAASSILLNLAEGSGRWGKRDKTSFYRTSRASACECVAALDLFEAYKLVEKEAVAKIKPQFQEVIRELDSLMLAVDRRKL